jgi:hypothetical protein
MYSTIGAFAATVKYSCVLLLQFTEVGLGRAMILPTLLLNMHRVGINETDLGQAALKLKRLPHLMP